MANFMGPMAPPQAAPQQPPQMDVKTSPMQRSQFKNFMRSMSAPTMPQVLPNIGMGVPSPDQTMAPMPSNPMMNFDIFSEPVQYMAGGGMANRNDALSGILSEQKPVQYFRYGGYSGGIGGGERGGSSSGGGSASQGSSGGGGFSGGGGGGGGGGRERAMAQRAQAEADVMSALNDAVQSEGARNQSQPSFDAVSDILDQQIMDNMINDALQSEDIQGAYGLDLGTSPTNQGEVFNLASYIEPAVLQVVDDVPEGVAPFDMGFATSAAREQAAEDLLDTPSYTTSIYDSAMTDLEKRANQEISGFPVSIPGTDISFKIPTSFDLITTGIGSYMAGNIEDKIKAGGQPVYDANNKIIGVNHPGFLGGTVYTGQNFPEERQGRDFVPPILPAASDIQSEDVTQTPPNQIGGILDGGVTTPEANQQVAAPTAQSVVVPSTRTTSPFFMRPQATFDPSQILTAEYFRNLLTPQRPLAMQKGGSVIDAAAERFLGSLRAA